MTVAAGGGGSDDFLYFLMLSTINDAFLSWRKEDFFPEWSDKKEMMRELRGLISLVHDNMY